MAREISSAKLVVQNGVGYDDWAKSVEAASPDSARAVIDVQQPRGLPDATPNPHLWYDPATMPEVAAAIAAAPGKIDPAHAPYHTAQYHTASAASFTASLSAWTAAIATFKATYPAPRSPPPSRWRTTCCRRRAPAT